MACGAGPVAAVMELARRTGATEARMLMRTNSRDINPLPGSSYIVGYAAAMFC
jgi:AmmeMemoRadiSam system protein B